MCFLLVHTVECLGSTLQSSTLEGCFYIHYRKWKLSLCLLEICFKAPWTRLVFVGLWNRSVSKVASLLLSDTQNNNLSLPVAKTSTFSGRNFNGERVTLQPAHLRWPIGPILTLSASVHHFHTHTCENRAQVNTAQSSVMCRVEPPSERTLRHLVSSS